MFTKLRNLFLAVFLGSIAFCNESKAVVPDPIVVTAAVSDISQNEELYFTNQNLADVLDVTLTAWDKFGGAGNQVGKEYSYSTTSSGQSGLYLLQNDGSTLTIEFHADSFGAYGGVGNGFCLQLTQVDADIYGKLLWYAGFTGASVIFTESWESKKKSNWNDYNNRNATYSVACTELKLTFSQATAVERTVVFLGKDGATEIAKVIVPAGERTAVAPDPPTVDGYVFWKWDTDFSNVTDSMTVTALYHRLCTVTFKDADGSILKTEIVEETNSATAPDMTGKENFLGWDVEFDAVTEDLVVTAQYGNPPDIVMEVIATGLLDGVSNALIFGAEDGVWNSEGKSWYTSKGVSSKWKAGSIAVFPVSEAVTVSGQQSVGGMIVMLNASKLSFSGDPLEFTGSAEILYHRTADIRFNNEIVGNVGFTQNVAEGVVSPVTEFAGNYAATGTLTVNDGTVSVVGEGTLFGGELVASGSSCETPIILGDEATFLFDSTAAQTIATLLNATNAGSGYGTIKKCITKGRFVIGPNARQVTLKCGSEGLHRFYNGVDIYGTVTLADGTYHLFCENTYGATIHDGGVLNVGSGYGIYGHRDQIVTCLSGGTINYTRVQAMGVADKKATFDGGTGFFASDYSTSADDNAMKDIVLKNGGTLTGVMMTWGWNRTTCTLTVDGTTPSSITLEKIRFGQKGITATSTTKMQEILVVQDVTGNADADLIVSSTIFTNATAVCEAGNEAYFGIVKQGPGTVLFTGKSLDYDASLTMEAGTVSFGSSAVFDASTLIVNGDATIDVAMGAKLTFADSSAMTWSEGAKLSFTGDFGTKSVRIGTGPDSLTGDQLAALQYMSSEGKTRPLGIDEEGYLLPPLPGTLFISR